LRKHSQHLVPFQLT